MNDTILLRAVASVDPRPDVIEDVLNVSPAQAKRFGARHLRLAWVDSAPAQGWAGRCGLARVRVDAALCPLDPAVLIMAGVKAEANDPVVDLKVRPVPAHFVMPWAAVELAPCNSMDGGTANGGQDKIRSLRPASALELLRNAVLQSGTVAYLLGAPTDRTCREARVLCRRAPEFDVPVAEGPHKGIGGCTAFQVSRSSETGRYRQQDRRRGPEGCESKESLDAGVEDGGDRNRGGARSPGLEGFAWATGQKRGGWTDVLRDWGAVSSFSDIIIPHEAVEVRYYDVDDTSDSQDWVSAVLRTYPASVIEDVHAALELISSTTRATDDTMMPSRHESHLAEVDTKDGDLGALLVHGPPGVGKTRLVEATAARLRCRLVKVSPGRLVATAGVHADRALEEVFRYCRTCVAERVVLLLDAVDRLLPSSRGIVGASRGEVDAGMLNTFVLSIEQARRDPAWRGQTAVVAVTSWPDQLHPTARRCASQEVLVTPPSQALRAVILEDALRRSNEGDFIKAMKSTDFQEALKEVVGSCQGFTAGDMCGIAAAAARCFRHMCATTESTTSTCGDALRAGFGQVRTRVSITRGGTGVGFGSASISEVPSVHWSEVGGLERAKQAVQEMVVWPTRHPEAFHRMGITPASGVLLFGPPGTGKTLLAKAAATETGATFIELKISDVVRGEIGESEKAIDRAFRTARELAPSIVFIDEFQALFASRETASGTGSRLASQLLVCMDELVRWRAAAGVWTTSRGNGQRTDGGGFDARRKTEGHEGPKQFDDDDALVSTLGGENDQRSTRGERIRGGANVMVLAATNAPEAIDSAFLRPGRFDEIVYAGLPDDEGRRHIIRAAKARMEALPTVTSGARLRPYPSPCAGADLRSPKEPTRSNVTAGAVSDRPEALQSSSDSGRMLRACVGGSRVVARWAPGVDETWLSHRTRGYSGADLSSLMKSTVMSALQEYEGGGPAVRRSARGVGDGITTASDVDVRREIVLDLRHFEAALASTRPSSAPEAVAKHETWARQWHVK